MTRSRLVSLDAIAHYAESAPQSPALIEPDGATFSYKDLWAQIEMVSRRLEEAGIGAGERVALLLPQGGGEVLAAAGVLNCHTAITLKTKSSTTEVEACLKMLSVSALIAAPEFEAQVEAAIGLGITVLIARKGESPKDWHIRVPALQLNQRNPPPEAVTFSFSSGTTGTSKIVPVTATNLNARITSLSNYVQLTASDRLLLMISQSFGVSVLYTHAQFSVGGVVIATEGFDPASYSSWLNKLRPTWYICAPTVHHAALSQLKVAPPRRPLSLRFIESSFAPLPEELREEIEQILGVPLLTQYGATEAGIIASDFLSSGGHVPNRVGRSRGSEIGIMNSSGLLLPVDQEGEIAVRGPAVASGYVDNPEATRAAFRDGWYRTGDAGRLDADGNLYLTGRLKEIINRGGEKIFPGEVDAVIASHPAVLEAASFAVPHPTLGENLACAVVLRKESIGRVTAIELRQFAAERLASFKVPHRIRFVDQIPRSELGKPQRWLLAQNLPARAGYPPAPHEISVRRLSYDVDDIFYKLHEIWARILERNDLTFDEDFFEAGGDSLAAINMLAEVDERFGSQTSEAAAAFLDEPTLERLTDLVGKPKLAPPDRNDSAEIRVFPVTAEDSGPCLFCVPSNKEEGLYFRRLATHLRGNINLLIVRPANTLHSCALFTYESAGIDMANEVRKVQPEGPYLLGGYCYGGTVAVEAARKLRKDGHDVRVVLFDTPMPGWPPVLHYGHAWLDKARHQWKEFCGGDSNSVAGRPSLPHKLLWLRGMLGIFVRRCLWSAIVPFRSLLAKVELSPTIAKFLAWTQAGFLPLYRPQLIDAPILHFLCADEPRIEENISRYGWREVAAKGITEQLVALDHPNTLHESNLPSIAQSISAWIKLPVSNKIDSLLSD